MPVTGCEEGNLVYSHGPLDGDLYDRHGWIYGDTTLSVYVYVILSLVHVHVKSFKGKATDMILDTSYVTLSTHPLR